MNKTNMLQKKLIKKGMSKINLADLNQSNSKSKITIMSPQIINQK